METFVIDEFGGSINGSVCWQLVRTMKQRGNLSARSDSKLREVRGSFGLRSPSRASVSSQSCAVSKMEIGKLHRMSKSTIRFLSIFAKIDPIQFLVQVSFVL
jgi:hypothetical protein